MTGARGMDCIPRGFPIFNKEDKSMKLDLQRFAGSLTVTVHKDSGITTASASPASSLAKDDTVALTITPASGKELDEIEVIEGGVTPAYDEDDGWTFDMGEADVVLFVKSKNAKKYKVVENTPIWVNGVKTELARNMMLEIGKNGAIVGVTCEGTDLNISADLIEILVESGAIVKM